jgi:predicted dehydrogenase
MTPLRFGLLGTSYWALNTHGAALVRSPHCRLEGVWGRDPAKAGDVAAHLGTTAYQDLDELLGQVDAVAMSVPPDVQAALAVRAAQAGCHMLLEKPLALDVAQGQAVVDAVDAAGTATIVFFTARYLPDVEGWTEQAVQAGPWPSAHVLKYANIYQSGSPFGASPWRRERGALWDNGPHAVAGLLPIMGPVTSVVARRGAAGSDTVHLLLTHGTGPTGTGPTGTGPTGTGPTGTGSPASPTGTSVVSLSLTMAPGANLDHFALYQQGASITRPERSFEPADAMENALAELAGLVETGQRAHRCDPRFALEVTRTLAASEAALKLPGADLPAAAPHR